MYLFLPQSYWISVNVFDVVSLLCLVHLTDALPAEELHEPSEGVPVGGVHVNVVPIMNVLVVHLVGTHPSGSILRLQEVHKVTKKLTK